MARRHLLALFAVLALTTICYWPGLFGPFVFDSGQNIVENPPVHVANLSVESLSHAADGYRNGFPFHRQLTMVSFGLNYYWTGLNPFWFKATNLALHLANGVLVFLLASTLLGALSDRKQILLSRSAAGWVAVAVAAAWVLHPINLTAVLHSAQRATLLSAFFVLGGMTVFLAGRVRILEGRRGGPFS